MSGHGDDLGEPRLPDPAAVPYLPDPAAVPYLPDAPRPIAEPAAEPAFEPEFDVKAMIASQRVKANPNPLYGDMPVPTLESNEALEQLRAEASKKRRRNRRFGRATLAVFCGIVAVAGYLAYDAFQDEQAARDATTGTDPDPSDTRTTDGDPADASDEPGALTPVGVQAEVIAGMDTLNDVATGSAGGFLDAIDDARAAVDDLNEGGAASGDASAAPAVALPGTIDAAVLRYDLGSVADPVVHHIVADLANDTYLVATVQGGSLRDGAETGRTEVARYKAGTATRTARSNASRAPGPDALFVSAVSPGVLLPPSAEPHARPTSIGLTGADGRPIAAEAYIVDVEAYRAADPAAAEAWLTVLALADPTATLDEGMPNLESNLLEARRQIDDVIARVDGGAVSGAPPIAAAGQVVVGWTAGDGEPYATSAYAASGDGTFQWLYRVTAVDQPAVAIFGVE